MPMYEFRCGACAARFEALASVGSDEETCRRCGAPGAVRLLSAPAETPKFVKTGSATRRQEERNRRLSESTKRQFSERRRRATEAARGRSQNGPAG